MWPSPMRAKSSTSCACLICCQTAVCRRGVCSALHRDLAWQLGEPGRPFFDTHASEDLGAYLHDYRRDLLVRHRYSMRRTLTVTLPNCCLEPRMHTQYSPICPKF